MRGAAVLTTVCLLAAGAAAQPAPGPMSRWFLAEGATAPMFDMNILVANPNATAADIKVTFLPRTGPRPDPVTFQMPPASRATLRANEVPGVEAAEVSAVVECTNGLDILVERSMYWPRGTWTAGHNSPGLTSTATAWFLAEGATNSFFDTFVLIANPDPAADAEVTVTFLPEGAAPIVRSYRVAAGSRFNIWVNDPDPAVAVAGLENASFSTRVESTNGAGIAVERVMYWPLRAFAAGHGSAGVSQLASQWHFAEGYTGAHPVIGRFHTWFELANPDPAVPAHVGATYYTDGGATLQRDYTVAPASRLTIYANAVPGLADAAFATRFQSDLPIAAERAMYWGPNGQWVEGHNSAGVTSEATRWGFAEGTAENGFDSYFLVRNATDAAMTVTATFLLEDGTGAVRQYSVPARSRFNIWRGNLPEVINGRRFATVLESTTPFVAERSVYWGPSYSGGHASAGTPWATAVPTPPPATLPAPTLTTASPSSGSTAGGTAVALTGAGFLAGATVTFGGQLASSVSIPLGSSTRMTVVTPAHVYGTVDVVVTNPDGQQATLPDGFTYVPPVPRLLVPDTLAFGDSITAGISSYFGGTGPGWYEVSRPYPLVLRELLAGYFPLDAPTVQNAGKPGEYAVFGSARLPTVMTEAHDLVIVLEGVNDTNVGTISTGEIASALAATVNAALAAGKRVILSTLTPVIEQLWGGYKADPVKVAALNDAIRALAQSYAGDPRFLLVDMFAAFPPGQLTALLSPDGLHPSEAGYQLMAEVFFNAIVAAFAVGG